MRVLQFPCIKLKCILYPVCRHKEHIECQRIGEYYHLMRNDYHRNDVWNEMKYFLRGMKSFRDGKTEDPDYIYLEEVINGKHGNQEYQRIFGQEPGV